MEVSIEDEVLKLILNVKKDVNEDKHRDCLEVTDYVYDIMEYLKSAESKRLPSKTYMLRQPDITVAHREILIDWLIDIHLKFKMATETLYLCVNLLDRFLERRGVSRKKLQLVGCATMLLAAKYEEVYAPEIRDFLHLSGDAYTRQEMVAMESVILNTLEFNLTVPSPHRFVVRFIKVGSLSEQETHAAHYLLEITLQEYRMLQYLPSMQAAASVYLSCKISSNSFVWSRTLEAETGYTEEQMKDCLRDLYAILTQNKAKYNAVRIKYASARFLRVSTLKVGAMAF